MISVVVAPSGPLAGILYHVLSRCNEVLWVNEKEICLPDIAPDVLLVSSPVPLECDGDVIYVLGALKEVPDENFAVGQRAVAVVNSQNAQGLSFAAQHHLKTLTCGLSNKDTLTLSSLREDSAVICLQREIKTLGGGHMEPAEIPVRLRSPIERGDLLSLAAVLLLCGDSDFLNEPL